MVERARRIIRKLIGSNSQFYKASSAFLDFITVTQKDGIRTWLNLRQLAADNSEQLSPISLSLKNLRYPIFVRPGTTDVRTVINNIIREEYGHFQQMVEPQWMVDAGAYIGDTTAYFLSRFPKLKIIALEPNPPFYEIASRNLKSYGARTSLMKKGLWADDQPHFFGGDSTGASVREMGFEIECISLPTILKQFCIDKLDILKMDIEGAEKAIFVANPEAWLDRIGLLIIEIHGPEIFHVVSLALQRNNFCMRQYRSVWYCEPIR